MKLNIDTLKKITIGAANITENEKGFVFHRFTVEQEELYKTSSFASKVRCTSGIKFCFKTDSRRLYIKTDVDLITRGFFAFDIFKNDKKLGQITNIPKEGIKFTKGGDLPSTVFIPMGVFEKEFDLGDGEKTVTVYFPWSAAADIIAVELDDGASIIPVEKKIKMLNFGDSITQGYDAFSPSGSYTAIITDELSAESRNKGIGGERFIPELAKCRDDFEPDVITVAYGTNDWCHETKETFDQKCFDFYKTLSLTYPNSKIFALTPIWRGDCNETTNCGSFYDIGNFIKKTAEMLPNVIAIESFDFVPHDEKYFSDFFLHPNDAGFVYYGKALAFEIKKHLDEV